MRLGEETRQVLVRSSRARSMDRNQNRGRGLARSMDRNQERGTKLGKGRSLGRHQARSMDGKLDRRRFNRQQGGGSGRTRGGDTRTRAGRQETGAAPVFSNFEASYILTSTPSFSHKF